MVLTTEDLNKLKAPFKAKDHEFLRGFVYITEFAIVTRIEEVDPSWGFEITRLESRPAVGDKPQVQVICTAALTISGVTRHGVGQAKAYETKSYQDKKTGETKQSEEANEAEKSAATDALKRAARLFGIGRYILALPDDIKNERDLDIWLRRMLEAKAKAKADNRGLDKEQGLPDNRMPNLHGDESQDDIAGQVSGGYEDVPSYEDTPKESYTLPSNMVVTKMSKSGKPYMVVEGCTFFSRDAFRLLSYDDTIIDSLGEVGITKLPDTVTVVYTQDDDFKKPLRVRRNSLNAVVDVINEPFLLAMEGQ